MEVTVRRVLPFCFLSATILFSCCNEPGSPQVTDSTPPSTQASAPRARPNGEVRKEEEPAVSENAEKELEELERKRKELGEEFLSAKVGQFHVFGNCSKEDFEQIKRWTIQGCTEALYKDFFDARPTCTYTVYLFKDDATYRDFAKNLFGDEDISKFGYYKPSAKALVMNIKTGTGTLVHEMVHAFMDADFPDSPAWFSEGMGSLFEQCSVKENARGHIHGMINWRFPILRKALENSSVAPLAEMISTTRNEFYGEKRDLYYAMARYLCMFAQQKGLLPKLYKNFRDNFKDDRTGRRFLEEAFGKKLEDIEKEWHTWVKEQKYME